MWYSRNTFIQAIERKKNAEVFTEKERISRARSWFWKTKEIKKQRSNQTDDRYHGPLITNEVSLGYIKFFPWLMLPFTAFLYFVAGHDDPIGIIKVLFLSATIINIASLLFGLFTPLINRFKSLTYILVALVVWTVTLTFTFIFLLMVTDDKTPFSALKLYESKLTLFYVIPIVLLFIVMTVIYAWYYLPQNQGKIWKINRWKTYAVNSKKKELLLNIAKVLGFILLVIAVITDYIQMIFGFFFGALMAFAFPAVLVDAIYAAIYIKDHPDYEEL